MKKSKARTRPTGAIPPRPTRAIDIAAILVRNAIPIVGIVAFDWSAVQFLVLTVFNLAMTIVNIGLAGASASTLRGEGSVAPKKIGFADLAGLIGVGAFLAVILTTMGAWPIFVIAGKDAGALLQPGFWAAVLSIVIASIPSIRADVREKVQSPMSLEELKARDQTRVSTAFFGIGASLVMSGWAAQLGSFALAFLVVAFTAFALMRELRPDLLAIGLQQRR